MCKNCRNGYEPVGHRGIRRVTSFFEGVLLLAAGAAAVIAVVIIVQAVSMVE